MTAVFLQVRLDSSRLPKKALLKIEDLTIIEHAMRALKKVNADLFLLVTTKECVEVLGSLASKCGFQLFWGPKDDVLKRFLLAAEKYKVKTIIRATGDNPLVSSDLANEVLIEHRSKKSDYSNWTDAPLGTGVEIVETEALIRANSLSAKNYDHEHVTPFIYSNQELFKVNIKKVPYRYCSDFKVSIDTIEDLKSVRKIYQKIYKGLPIKLDDLMDHLKQDI